MKKKTDDPIRASSLFIYGIFLVVSVFIANAFASLAVDLFSLVGFLGWVVFLVVFMFVSPIAFAIFCLIIRKTVIELFSSSN